MLTIFKHQQSDQLNIGIVIILRARILHLTIDLLIMLFRIMRVITTIKVSFN